jgi:hypothetical protein
VGLVIGKWRFADANQVPSAEIIASQLASATGLQAIHSTDRTTRNSRIDIPVLTESVFDIEQAGTDVVVFGYIPAHPYLWENLDHVLEKLGGTRTSEETHWRPDDRFRHLRRPWEKLSAQQRFLLRVPTIGAARVFDRFV